MPIDTPGKPGGDIVPGAMTEHLTDDWGFFVRASRQFERFRSPFQMVEVSDSVAFGKLFRLDGHFMTSEKDEFFYHENLVHLAALTHPSPEHALIIGGGDGGSAEELLKHPSIRSVTLCEIDLAVIDIARKYLQGVHRGALDDPRLTLRIGDGFEHVRETDAQYDIIVLDLTDPGGPSESLYTPDFYQACALRLKPVGAMTLHVASPVAHPRADPRGYRQPARGVSHRHAVPGLDSALRRHVDDGVRVADARSEEPVDAGDRPAHLAARLEGPAVLQRRHAPGGAVAAQLRPRPRCLGATCLSGRDGTDPYARQRRPPTRTRDHP